MFYIVFQEWIYYNLYVITWEYAFGIQSSNSVDIFEILFDKQSFVKQMGALNKHCPSAKTN